MPSLTVWLLPCDTEPHSVLWETGSPATTSQSAWTLTSLHWEPIDPQRMPSPVPFTQSSHIWKFNRTSHETEYHICIWILDFQTWQTRDSFDRQSHLFHSTLEFSRDVYSATSYSCCTNMTAIPSMEITLLWSSGWQNHHWSDFKQWWEFISRGNQQSCRLVGREQLTAQNQQTQGAKVDFIKQESETHTSDLRWIRGIVSSSCESASQSVMDIRHLHLVKK